MGLSSRSRFERLSRQEVVKTRRSSQPLSLLLLSVESYADVTTGADLQAAGTLSPWACIAYNL